IARSLPFSAAPVPAAAAIDEGLSTKGPEPAQAAGPIGRETTKPSLRSSGAPPLQPQQPASTPAAVPVPIENTRTIEIDRFVPRTQIDPVYFDTPYYVTPRDEVGQEAYAIIRDAMRQAGMVGMGRVVLAKRERPIIIEPLGEGLRGITLRYAH